MTRRTVQYQTASCLDELDCKVHETLAFQEWIWTRRKPAKRIIFIYILYFTYFIIHILHIIHSIHIIHIYILIKHTIQYKYALFILMPLWQRVGGTWNDISFIVVF